MYENEKHKVSLSEGVVYVADCFHANPGGQNNDMLGAFGSPT